MRAENIMSRNVTTARPETDVREIATTLLAREVSAVPIVDGEGRLVGIVSECDLMRRQDIGTGGRLAWWKEITLSSEVLAALYVKSHGGTAADVMTRPVIAVEPDTDVAEIADLFEKYGIKRVPVVEDGTVVGIVSRADLVGLLRTELLRREGEAEPLIVPDDGAVRWAIAEEIRAAAGIDTQFIYIDVHDGSVDLWGTVRSKVEKRAVELAVQASACGRTVQDHLIVMQAGAVPRAL